MIRLIAKIELCWEQKIAFKGIHPNDCNGLFDFRNKILNT